MRKIVVLLFVFVIAALFLHFARKQNSTSHTSIIINQKKTPSPLTENVKTVKSLFIPYWTLSSPVEVNQYERFVYFGITSDSHGVDRTEPGFLGLSRYVSGVNPQNSLLALNLTDKTINDEILDSPALQQSLVTQAIAVAQEYHFNGILLDFEVSGIGFDSVTKKVTTFVSLFSNKTHSNHLQFATALYSDTFYRARPYDVKIIGKISDDVFVMAYDFHKVGGDPGPNFPFAESTADGYTFTQMIADFMQQVPKEKLTVVFGMFGYDWPVTENGSSIAAASPISLAAISKSFIDSCAFTACLLRRNSSDEPSIAYTDANGQNHLIWFEDKKSVQKKIDYLQTKGIGSIAFWANSYF